tara:strand:+ start:1549 stop:5955 length:4407 start_codon:yes stop_codon:yes gene_type:complete
MSIFKVILKTEESKLLFFGDRENYSEYLTDKQKHDYKEEDIIFSEYRIYPDDTIQTVKNKILLTIEFDLCYEELYIFGNQDTFIETDDIDNYEDTREFKKNAIKIDTSMYDLKTIIGYKYDGPYDYLFPVEPYNYTGQDKVLFDLDNSVLLSFLCTSNTLYVCPCEDVVMNVENDKIISVYYPLLYKRKIDSLSKLRKERTKMVAENRKKIPADLLKMYKCVDILHDINKVVPDRPEYVVNGINSFSIAMKTQYNILPLDAIFKCIHATKDCQYIKYNPGFSRDTFYRLYSERTAKNGRKIPFLKISEILKYSRDIGKKEQIAIMVNRKYHENQKHIHIILSKNGNITINGTFSVAVEYIILESLLTSIFESVIENINDSIERIGYSINRFVSLTHKDIIINSLTYTYTLNITKNIDLSKYRNLLYSLFLLKKVNMDDGDAQLMFKRVDNYIVMNEIDEFITIKRKETEDIQDIIASLIKELQMDEESARKHVIEFFGEHRILNGELIDNIGFPITMELQKAKNQLTIVTTNINNIYYIKILEEYYDAIVKLFQNSDSLKEIIDVIQITTKKKINEKAIEKTKISPVVQAIVMPQTLDNDFFSNNDQIEGVTEEDDVFGMMDEEEEDDVFGMMDEEEEEETSGGAGDDLDVNVTGMKLNNPNPFYSRIENRDPAFVLKKDSGKYNSYSRTCPPAEKRQPMILNKKEMENIEKNHRESYNEALEYSTKDEPFWYICPRYWSLKDNTSFTEKEVEAILKKTPNAIIPPGSKTVPEGSYIYEFKHPKQHINAKGEYIYQYPGLIHDAHPDGYSIPCCFKKQKKRDAVPKKVEKTYNYIVDSIKYPVPNARLGFLPLPVQIFFNNNAQTCISKTNSALLNGDVKCLLRAGSEQNILSSFIGAIAGAYAEEHQVNIPSIEQMMIILSESLTLDDFINYNNSSLVSVFRSEHSENVDIEMYKKSKLYKMVYGPQDVSNDEDDFFRDTVKSFENFKMYINDNSAFIDHTFLWEVVSESNLKIFKNGVNLIILEIYKSKSNSNIRILCPTNPYSQRFFDPSKKSIILLKQDDFYELLCIQNGKKTIKLLPSNESLIQDALKFIEENINTTCRPKKSLINYEYERNLSALETENLLRKYNISIKNKVVNFQSKIVGFFTTIFVPCTPSSLFEKHSRNDRFMNNSALYKNYATTIEKLNEIYEKTNGEIPCKPIKKVVHNGNVHGIRTMNNLYVKLKQLVPITKIDDNLPIEHSNDYMEADVTATTSRKSDKELEVVSHINLETQYYSVFRTVVRILFNRRENLELKTNAKEIIDDSEDKYENKIKKLVQILKSLTHDHVEFNDVNVKKIEVVHSCFRNCKSKQTCKHRGDICVFEIPKHNIIEPEIENDIFYFVKLADELLRVYSIYAFIMDPHRFLNYNNMKYSVNEDEILLVDALVNHDYFNEMEILDNKFIGQITYDIAIPDKKQQYSNRVEKM